MKYKKIIFKLEFEREIYFSVYPSFLFRSVLGKELRKLSCLFKDRKCNDCDLRFQCAYSRLFESPVKDNVVLRGRNFAPHPLIMYLKADYKKLNRVAKIELVLIEDAVNYLPYIYYSLKKAGEDGLLRDRIKYKIEDVVLQNNKSLLSDRGINTEFLHDEWIYTDEEKSIMSEIEFSFVTPLRIKKNGRYLNDKTLGYEDLINAAIRRIKILYSVYKSEDIKIDFNFKDKSIVSKNLYWVDLYHYSSRQKGGMKLGGVCGNMTINGEFSSKELALFEFMKIFNVGKNISFGLGKFDYEFIKKI